METGLVRPVSDLSGDLEQQAGRAGEHAGSNSISASATPAGQQVADNRLSHVQDRTYSPSWIDRLTGWVSWLPLPAWLFYVALGAGLSLLLLSIAWAGGVLALGTFSLNYALPAITYAYLLALIHYLDHSAAVALTRFRPVMTVDDAGYDKLRYQLTTLPARPTLIASALGAVYALATLLVNVLTVVNPAREAAPLAATLVDLGLSLLLYYGPAYVLLGVLVYHTLHQLHMVNTIYTKHTRINLFQRGPLYALSGLTARTAVGLGLPTYVWFQFNSLSAPGTTASDVFQALFLGAVIVVTFIWPLLGAHSLLEVEKQRLQDEVGRRIEAIMAALHSKVDAGELADLAAQREALNVLVTEQGVIDKLRTWPWRAETLSGLGAAFLAPVVIWVLQRVLERLGF